MPGGNTFSFNNLSFLNIKSLAEINEEQIEAKHRN